MHHLDDETFGEFAERLRLLDFLSWMKKHGQRVLPPSAKRAHALIDDYLVYDRQRMRRRIMKERRHGT